MAITFTPITDATSGTGLRIVRVADDRFLKIAGYANTAVCSLWRLDGPAPQLARTVHIATTGYSYHTGVCDLGEGRSLLVSAGPSGTGSHLLTVIDCTGDNIVRADQRVLGKTLKGRNSASWRGAWAVPVGGHAAVVLAGVEDLTAGPNTPWYGHGPGAVSLYRVDLADLSTVSATELAVIGHDPAAATATTFFSAWTGGEYLDGYWTAPVHGLTRTGDDSVAVEGYRAFWWRHPNTGFEWALLGHRWMREFRLTDHVESAGSWEYHHPRAVFSDYWAEPDPAPPQDGQSDGPTEENRLVAPGGKPVRVDSAYDLASDTETLLFTAPASFGTLDSVPFPQPFEPRMIGVNECALNADGSVLVAAPGGLYRVDPGQRTLIDWGTPPTTPPASPQGAEQLAPLTAETGVVANLAGVLQYNAPPWTPPEEPEPEPVPPVVEVGPRRIRYY
jgi:hypothetical protein